jgi:hypothetical protein
MQKMQSNDLLKSNENNGDNAKVTAYMNATLLSPRLHCTGIYHFLHLSTFIFWGMQLGL